MRLVISCCCIVGYILAASTLSAADTVTYGFNTAPGWTNLTTNVSNGGTTTGYAINGSGGYQHTLSGGSNSEVREHSGFVLSERKAGTDFTLTARFTVASYTAAGSYSSGWTVKFLGSGGGDALPVSYYGLLVQRTNASDTTIFSLSKQTSTTAAVTLQSQQTSFAYVTAGVEYTMTIDGNYQTNGSLILDYSIARPGGSTYTGSFTDATPLIGNYFGIRERERAFTGGGWGNTFTTAWNDYTVDYTAVPEPTGLALLAVAGFAAMQRRRRPM